MRDEVVQGMRQERVEKERRKPGTINMCWQQRFLVAFLSVVSAGGFGFGVVNNSHTAANEDAIRGMRTATELKVQGLSEQHAAVTEKIEGLKRDVDRVEKNQNRMETKIDRLVERKN